MFGVSHSVILGRVDALWSQLWGSGLLQGITSNDCGCYSDFRSIRKDIYNFDVFYFEVPIQQRQLYISKL